MAVVVLATPGGWDVAFAEAAQLGKLDIVQLEEPLAPRGLSRRSSATVCSRSRCSAPISSRCSAT
jgi:hypothetical protein